MHMKCMLWFESRDRVIYCLRRRGFFVAVWRGYAVLRCIGFATETASRALSAGGAAEISAGPFRGLLFCSKMRRGRFEPERAWGADGGLLWLLSLESLPNGMISSGRKALRVQ